MHKRSYVRRTQEERPWARITPVSDSDTDVLQLSAPKTVRWTSGNRRDRETRTLNAYIATDNKKMLLNSIWRDAEIFSEQDPSSVVRRRDTLTYRAYKLGRHHALATSKNSCIFSGKGSTFNRFLYVSRQTLRNLTRFGLVSGLISGKRG